MARPQKIDKTTLTDKLFEVIRSKGYSASSLTDLSESCGLQKASLYHRFPGGKKEITTTVLEFVRQWSQTKILDVFGNDRQGLGLSKVLTNINSLYESGDKSCILRTLAVEPSFLTFGDRVKLITEMWIEGFTILGENHGLEHAVARRMATNVLIKIQGTLVIGQILGSKQLFTEMLESIEKDYSNLSESQNDKTLS